MFAENFDVVIRSFNKHKVEFMIVGGYAVNFHGYERSTSDLDIWVKSIPENLSYMSIALIELGFDGKNVKQLLSFDISKPFLFHIGSKPNDVEVFNFISGVKYEDAEPHKIPYKFPKNLNVYFISLKDLIINKMNSGRLKDKGSSKNSFSQDLTPVSPKRRED